MPDSTCNTHGTSYDVTCGECASVDPAVNTPRSVFETDTVNDQQARDLRAADARIVALTAERDALRADLAYIHGYMHDEVCEQAAAGDEPTDCDHGHCYAYWRIGAKLNA